MKQKNPLQQKLIALRSTNDYRKLHNTMVDIVKSSHPSRIPQVRDTIARILQASYNKEAGLSREDPKKLNNIDQKYSALRTLLLNLTTPQRQLAGMHTRSRSNPTWKSPLVMGTAAITTLGGAFLLLKKFSKTKDSSPAAPAVSGFQKTLAAIQKYKLISQLDFDSNFIQDYENIMNGKVKKVARKKPYSKADAWEQDEASLMKEIDSSFRSISSSKSSGYKIPELPEPKGIDPFAFLNNGKTKPKKERKPKVAVDHAEEIEPEIEPSPIPRVKASTRAKPTTRKPTSSDRLVPIVKRTKRVSKIKA